MIESMFEGKRRRVRVRVCLSQRKRARGSGRQLAAVCGLKWKIKWCMPQFACSMPCLFCLHVLDGCLSFKMCQNQQHILCSIRLFV